MRCEYARDDGAYVLGALAPGERATYERHLSACAGCRKAVGEMAVLPGLLARLDAATAEGIAAEADAAESSRLPRLLHAAELGQRRDRRRRRWQVAGAGLAAACLALVVGMGIAALRPDPGIPGAPSQMSAMVDAAGIHGPVFAEVALSEVSGGTKIWMHCTYEDTPDYRKAYAFRLVAIGTDDAVEQVASWKAGPGDDIRLDGVTRFARAELDRLELRKPDGTALLVYKIP